jgi:hypothetical protein
MQERDYCWMALTIFGGPTGRGVRMQLLICVKNGVRDTFTAEDTIYWPHGKLSCGKLICIKINTKICCPTIGVLYYQILVEHRAPYFKGNASCPFRQILDGFMSSVRYCTVRALGKRTIIMHNSYVLGSVFERRTDGNPRTLYHKAL